jgi:hypothetical protein
MYTHQARSDTLSRIICIICIICGPTHIYTASRLGASFRRNRTDLARLVSRYLCHSHIFIQPTQLFHSAIPRLMSIRDYREVSTAEAEEYELPTLGSQPKSRPSEDSGDDGGVLAEDVGLLSRENVKQGRKGEEDGAEIEEEEPFLRDPQEEEMVGKGSNIEELIARVSLRFSVSYLRDCCS